MHKKEMCETKTTKKEVDLTNEVDHELVDFHFKKEFARFDLKKPKVEIEKMNKTKVDPKISRRRTGG